MACQIAEIVKPLDIKRSYFIIYMFLVLVCVEDYLIIQD